MVIFDITPFINCRERSKVTLYFRLFIFYGIPMHLVSLHGDISRTGRRRKVVGWHDELLLDGYIYPDSNCTEWKLVVPNVCISNFMTIPTPVIFQRPKKNSIQAFQAFHQIFELCKYQPPRIKKKKI